MKINEYDSLTELNKIAQKMEDLEVEEKRAVQLMLENYIDEAIENLENMIYTGEDKMEDVAYSYIQETGMLQNMPESLQCYFDYEKLGNDMEMEGSYFRDSENRIWESLI